MWKHQHPNHEAGVFYLITNPYSFFTGDYKSPRTALLRHSLKWKCFNAKSRTCSDYGEAQPKMGETNFRASRIWAKPNLRHSRY